MDVPQLHYAESPRGKVAYQVVGDGPVTLLLTPPLAQNIEKMWEQPAFWRPARRLGRAVRFVHYDKLGTGLSDPVPAAATIEERLDELFAVVDAAGSERVWMFGMSEGGIIALAAAALAADVVARLVLVNTTSGAGARLDPVRHGPAPTAEMAMAFMAAVADNWTKPSSLVLSHFAPSLRAVPGIERWMAAYERAAASPAMIRTLVDSALRLDVTPHLARVRQPTIVLHHTGDRVVPISHGRFLAESIPGARFVEIDGHDHFAWVSPTVDDAIDEVLKFIGVDTPGARSDRLIDPWDLLTPAERRVARLAQRGMTNAEIATELGVSARTVETQLSRCYAKLEIRSRTELALLSDA